MRQEDSACAWLGAQLSERVPFPFSFFEEKSVGKGIGKRTNLELSFPNSKKHIPSLALSRS